MQTIRIGIIGGGLMGREFASAAARWMHLTTIDVRPEIVALCNRTEAGQAWFKSNLPSIKQFTTDYKALLANPDVDAVYIAVPHNLHAEFYCAAINAGKHLLGEKPFGIDKPANDAIMAAIASHPKIFVRCSSEFPFYPGMQQIGDMIDKNAFGQIIEVNTGFLHSSDLDPNKPINWKRMVDINGEYGVLGDLGMHACHVPFRAGWTPRNVRAVLSDIIKQRPDGKGGLAPCKTWDNATLLCESVDPVTAQPFPWTMKVQRIAPGEKNSWYCQILGTRACARWSSANPKLLEVLHYTPGTPGTPGTPATPGTTPATPATPSSRSQIPNPKSEIPPAPGSLPSSRSQIPNPKSEIPPEQIWTHIQTGYDTAFKTITGPIFDFGFTDSILQMWAAFLHELVHLHQKPLKKFAACVTPQEAALSHRLFTAALESQRTSQTVKV